jgi:hypothetical protein
MDRANTIQLSPGRISQRFLSLTKLRVSREMSGLEKLESEFFRKTACGIWLVRNHYSIGMLYHARHDLARENRHKL